MKQKRYLLISLLIFCLFVTLQWGYANTTILSNYRYGLTFKAHTVNQDQRTSLDLTPDRSLHLGNKFSLSFDIKLREELHTYGYVFRIISDDTSSCLDFISYQLRSKFNFILNKGSSIVENVDFIDSTQIVKDEWIKIRLDFTEQGIKISVNEATQMMRHSFKDFNSLSFLFGSNRHPKYYTTDVPPVSLRNIELYNQDGRIIRCWKLALHNRKGETMDEVEAQRAIVQNGIWEIDGHYNWQKEKSLKFDSKKFQCQNLQLAYDSIGGRIFMVLKEKVLVYHVDNKQVDTLSVEKGEPYFGVSRQVIYSAATDELISYSTEHPLLSKYNFATHEWSIPSTWEVDSRQHHNRMIDPETNHLILFGGYGRHTYNADFVEKGLNDGDQWQIISLDSCITPRYLSAMGIEDKDHILIMGGYGSRSGKQEESPQNYYDLYRLNIRDKSCSKVWSFFNEGEHFTFSNSMIIDTVADKLYALVYNNDRFHTNLNLCSFDICTSNPQSKIVSDSIEYDFLDIKSYCDLFLYQDQMLYAFVVQEKIPGEAVLDVYSLVYPPLSSDEIYMEKNKDCHFSTWVIYGSILICLVFFFFVIVYVYKKKKSKTTGVSMTISKVEYGEQEIAKPSNRKISAILLLGGFQVFDKQGNNITGEFTPTLKLLFLFLLLNSIKGGKGTTSQRLEETFWFDMSKTSAANNRRVNIRKLRLILETVGEVRIVNKNDYWYIDMGKDTLCDYHQVCKILNAFEFYNSSNKEMIVNFVELASLGVLLPNVSTEWVDEYKSEYSHNVIELLLSISVREEIGKDNKLLLKIADIILMHDCTDEDAIRIKCRALFLSGQKGLAKQCFDKYCADYNRLLNTSPEFTYDDVICES